MKTLKSLKLIFPAILLLFFFSSNDSNSQADSNLENTSRISIGSITGTIPNEGVVVTASVIVNGETVAVDINDDRVFLLENIPVGIYTVTLTPADGSGLTVKDVLDVEVTQDTVTDLGDITLE